MILSTIVCLFLLSTKMKVMSYIKLKKIMKSNYELYEYNGDIKAIFISQRYRTRGSFDESLDWSGPTTNGIKLIIEDQTFYLNEKVYYQLMFDKQITLYFLKTGDQCVLYDYKRILNENSTKNVEIYKQRIPKLIIVAIVMFVLMLLVFSIII